MQKINFYMYYLEHLPRLNTITGILGVRNDFKVENLIKFDITDDNSLTLVTKNDRYVLKLPCEMNSFKLQSLKLDENILSFSLKLLDQEKIHKDTPILNQTVELWSCIDLKNKTTKTQNRNIFTFNCKRCQNMLIDSKSDIFKDMPSEYWYEMMDFWHCHKPHNHQEHDKSYKILVPSDKNTIVIGSYYLLQLENEEIVQRDDLIFCRNCDGQLGCVFQNSFKIYKWEIQLHYGEDKRESFSTNLFYYNCIIDKINSSAVRKFEIENKYLWVINTGLNISIDGKIFINALKILMSEDVNDAEFYESIELPSSSSEFSKSLMENHYLLPKSMNEMSMGKSKYLVTYISS